MCRHERRATLKRNGFFSYAKLSNYRLRGTVCCSRVLTGEEGIVSPLFFIFFFVNKRVPKLQVCGLRVFYRFKSNANKNSSRESRDRVSTNVTRSALLALEQCNLSTNKGKTRHRRRLARDTRRKHDIKTSVSLIV